MQTAIATFVPARLARLALLTWIAAALGAPLSAASLPTGFTESVVASGLSSPTAMQFAPDGRLFVCEQGGRLRVIKDGTLLPTPFLTVTVSSSGERGLLGVAFDPAFATNGYVYVYYTATTPTLHNRVSRFTANGDVAAAGSEVVIFELDNLSSATNHNGGALAFGPDGKLYVASGENANGPYAQSLENVLGKILRLNPNGTIPTDNPFYGSASGKNRAIWALGLRNPFTFAFRPGAADMRINDVGANTWEEVNDGAPGANYGWPLTEGPTTDPRFSGPRYAYSHASGGCAVTGGAFYSPVTPHFPADYTDDYLFADHCGGWIRRLDATSNTVTTFATGLSAPVDLKVTPDGRLYYLARNSGGTTGAVYRVSYGTTVPGITTHPASRTATTGTSVTFSVRASGTAPLRYQWQRNGANIAGATAEDYTIPSVVLADNGVRFRAVVTNDFGNAISNEAVLTVTTNRRPTATITRPVSGTLYAGGTVIQYAGTGSDPENGTLPGTAFTWRVDFHHDTHTHPFIAPTSGTTGGSFTIPATGETSANVWYRIHLTVRDSGGLTHSTHRDVLPRKVRLTLTTTPSNLQLRLDGQPVATPLSFDSVVGIVRSIGTLSLQARAGVTYQFASWSDGKAATHSVSTPAANTTYTATFRAISSGNGTGLRGTYYDGLNFSGTVLRRIDSTVNFSWGTGAPAASMGSDAFSVRWTGAVEPQFTDTYTFYTQSDDGVRLWVNGQQLVDDWTDHGTTENLGTIALTAGQRYTIQMEFYENTGGATARLLWSSGSTPKAAIPTGRLYTQKTVPVIRVNFQPASPTVPSGHLADSGFPYGNRGNGYTYGWNVNNSAQARDRNAANSPDQRYDTLMVMQSAAAPDAVWEMALPNGTYAVRIVAGDPSFYSSVYRITAEGVLTVSGTPTSAARWKEGSATVTVSDGRLTIRSGAGATNNKICFLEIRKQ